jgi:hypothetical protein
VSNRQHQHTRVCGCEGREAIHCLCDAGVAATSTLLGAHAQTDAASEESEASESVAVQCGGARAAVVPCSSSACGGCSTLRARFAQLLARWRELRGVAEADQEALDDTSEKEFLLLNSTPQITPVFADLITRRTRLTRWKGKSLKYDGYAR